MGKKLHTYSFKFKNRYIATVRTNYSSLTSEKVTNLLILTVQVLQCFYLKKQTLCEDNGYLNTGQRTLMSFQE